MTVMPTPPSNFTAVLLGLSGCLVDFGARSKSATPASVHPFSHGAAATRLEPNWAETQPISSEQAQPTPGALELLFALQRKNITCAWIDDMAPHTASALTQELPDWLDGCLAKRAWPAPDACWQALIDLQAEQHSGCILIGSDPQMLQAALNAGFWTVGLAACGAACGKSLAEWQRLDAQTREKLRADATLQLYRLGVHSVIDDLTDAQSCLAELYKRYSKGERP
ncbi:HAD family phosphatase [Pseudomonas sp.]|uniref:HAD family phosphatase n=1 Tax=Pseudomonas sp. TaxID=306 RepID=UPI00257EEFF3|nr:HAD family phosphatase [Pseudomonas sp.]